MENKKREFMIIHFNDVYDIEPQSSEPVGGVARFRTVVNSLQKHYGSNIITLFSGDIFAPSDLAETYNGIYQIRIKVSRWFSP